MNASLLDANSTPVPAAWPYLLDVAQRAALAGQALVERGDTVLADEYAGLPLRLAFPHETVLDAREFPEPAAYTLFRIVPDQDACFTRCAGAAERPVIVFDPRAGHGPGIGGFKRDSELGMALHRGHPVYFVAHQMQPCPGQTLARVHHALRRFVAAVVERHPGTRPALYGNCQAGWAVALLAADCAGVTGPTILNGSPLSYWGGASGVNPMRLTGGLTGGVWATRFLADLGNGLFDGAHLVHNFEMLDPGHAWFGKYRALFDDPEGQRERFLEFERWWSEFCCLTRDEMVAIVANLFVGNRLEQGGVQIGDCCHADLRRLQSPMLVFASSGDNITPPQQALGWVPTIWPSTDALIAAGQRIVYLLNPRVGHLGIFVSADVARREHRAILDHLDALETLAPGLYEMRLLDATGAEDCRDEQIRVAFEPRSVEDLRPPQPDGAFERVRRLSEQLDAHYQQWVSPAVRAFANPAFAALLKWGHPMRVSRLAWSHALYPGAWALDCAATWARMTRQTAPADNPWRALEAQLWDAATQRMDDVRRARDAWAEAWFAGLYVSTGAAPTPTAPEPAHLGGCSDEGTACAATRPTRRARGAPLAA